MKQLAYQGDYVYRAVRTEEWEEIKKNGFWVILNRTNFEDKAGESVKIYQKEPGYAGLIIRVKVKGPYFVNAGLQVPRVVSTIPHFVNAEDIEVSKTGEEGSFIPLEDYAMARESVDQKNDPAVTDVGGIDFNPANMDLQIKMDANGVPLPIEFQNIPNIKIDGLYPVIINITPITNPLPLLGMAEKRDEEEQYSSL